MNIFKKISIELTISESIYLNTLEDIISDAKMLDRVYNLATARSTSDLGKLGILNDKNDMRYSRTYVENELTRLKLLGQTFLKDGRITREERDKKVLAILDYYLPVPK